ncbi:hypothetical protein BASA81_009326 [Batrachochytrium salamandrivorans]|nr:hypothetical protein BASA81_009326 [Batrachochytrium salamandrivorans]
MSQPHSDGKKGLSEDIEARLKDDKKAYLRIMRDPRLLLLGSGDSGKTTFLKQIKILHGGGFSMEEKIECRKDIAANILDTLAALLHAATKQEGVFSSVAQESADILHTYMGLSFSADIIVPSYKPLTKSIVNHIKVFWNDPFTQELLANGAKYKLNIQDTAEYFFSKIDILVEDNYTPTYEDIIHIRGQTTKITETVVNVGRSTYHFYDVGGQQKYRKQWTPYFDNVHAIVFVVSLACYDQSLMEDPTINRMHDALDLYGKICNHTLLRHIPITLFLNKKDLFEKKFPTSDIAQFFPDYNAKDMKRAIRYFEEKFNNENLIPDKKVMCHVTCCTDISAMQSSLIRFWKRW